MELTEVPVKRGFKKTEVGVIPEDWDVRTVGDLAEFTNGKPHEGDIDDSGSYWLITLDSIDIRGKLKSEHRRIASLDGSLQNGDLVIILSDIAHGRLLGLTDVIPDSQRYVLNQRVGRLRPNSVTDPQFLRLQINLRQEHFRKRGQGTSQRHIYRRDIDVLEIPFPPLPEQRAIATALSDVDGLLAGLDALIAKKKALKQGAMQQLLTGKQRLPGFKGEWESRPLSELITLLPGGIYGAENHAPGLIPCRVATTAHIEMDDRWNNKEMGVRYFTSDQLAKYRPIAGDLIVVKSSGSAEKIQSGKMGLIDANNERQFVFSNFLMLLRPKAVSPIFLYFYLCSNNVKKELPNLVEASTYPNIRINDYMELSIPVPSPKEQSAIAEVLSDMDAELGALEARRAKTALLKQGMMQELLTGRVRLV